MSKLFHASYITHRIRHTLPYDHSPTSMSVMYIGFVECVIGGKPKYIDQSSGSYFSNSLQGRDLCRHVNREQNLYAPS